MTIGSYAGPGRLKRVASHVTLTLILLAIVVLWGASGATPADFMQQDPEDKILKEIGVDEKLGAQVSLDIKLTDQDGRQRRLGDYFKGGPVALSLNYYECPMLCPITFANLSRTISGMGGLRLGRDFKVVTVSFNPAESLVMANEKSRQTYAMLKGADGTGESWPFLFGAGEDTGRLAKAVGFRFKELGPNNFAHPSVLIILSPEGKVTRYLYGIEHDPVDLRLALLEAADGRIGPSRALNQVLLYCFHYDPVGKKYAVAATRIMTASGVVVLVIAGLLFLYTRRLEKARKD